MHRPRDLDDLGLEQAAGVGVGQHDRGHVGPQRRLERDKVDAAALVGRDRLDDEAQRRRRRRVGAVRRFRRQHDLALGPLAARLEGGGDRHHAAHLAMRAGGRRHRHGRHAGQRLQPVRQAVDQLERALHGRDRLQGMQVADAGQARHLLVDARVVLHGARAQRIDAHVDGVVLLAEPRVVLHHLRLGEAGQADLAGAAQAVQAVLHLRRLRQVDAAAAGLAHLEDQRLLDLQRAVAGEGRRRCGRRVGGCRRCGPANGRATGPSQHLLQAGDQRRRCPPRSRSRSRPAAGGCRRQDRPGSAATPERPPGCAGRPAPRPPAPRAWAGAR